MVLTDMHISEDQKCSVLKALLPPHPQQWKSLNVLLVVLQTFAFKLGVSLSHFISYSSYQPCEVSLLSAFYRRGQGEVKQLAGSLLVQGQLKRGISACRFCSLPTGLFQWAFCWDCNNELGIFYRTL